MCSRQQTDSDNSQNSEQDRTSEKNNKNTYFYADKRHLDVNDDDDDYC